MPEVLERLRDDGELAAREFKSHNILRAELATNYGEGRDKYDNVTAIRLKDESGTSMLVRVLRDEALADDEGAFVGVSDVEIAFRGASEYETLAGALEFLAHAIRAQGAACR